MNLTIGFSPCPNDTFIFDALVNKKIDTEGLEFSYLLADVEELNQKALHGELPVTKLSYRTFADVCDTYNLLDSGSALGNHCGPLLIAKQPLKKEHLNGKTIAIPGKQTTANFLLSFYLDNAVDRKVFLFSDIEDAVLNEEVGAGVIIHENRFTYQEKGLTLVQDLGEYWETTTGYPIPLGGIAIKRSLDSNLQKKVNRLIRQSVEYSFNNNSRLSTFITENATEMSERVMRQHIDLYVNDYTRKLGKKGENAINFMMNQLTQKDINIVK